MDIMKYRTKRDVIIGAILFTVGLSLGAYLSVFIFEAGNISTAIDDASNFKVGTNVDILERKSEISCPTPMPSIQIKDSAVETSFISTLRSCLGSDCFDSRPDKSNLDRVGFLTIPNSGASGIFKALEMALSKSQSKVSIIQDSHVPPYGYGKNHGWNRIIRIYHKIFPHAQAILLNNFNFNASKINPLLFENQVRQIVRWHCRLSHVAAHTKMLTIFIEDFINRPVIEFEKILTFAGISLARNDQITIANNIITEIKKEIELLEDSNENKKQVMEKNKVPPELLAAGLFGLNQEMMSSDGLTKWPCKSFYTLTDPLLPLSPKSLSANCSAPFTKCTVQYDLRAS